MQISGTYAAVTRIDPKNHHSMSAYRVCVHMRSLSTLHSLKSGSPHTSYEFEHEFRRTMKYEYGYICGFAGDKITSTGYYYRSTQVGLGKPSLRTARRASATALTPGPRHLVDS
eukprot:scaffold77023_cov24-Prasinocladus_malaysianus.AAC.1